MRSAIHPRLVAAGVKEEFHIVDLATRRLTSRHRTMAAGHQVGLRDHRASR